MRLVNFLRFIKTWPTLARAIICECSRSNWQLSSVKQVSTRDNTGSKHRQQRGTARFTICHSRYFLYCIFILGWHKQVCRSWLDLAPPPGWLVGLLAYWINNEVWVGVGEIDPEGSGSLSEMAKPSRAVSQITRNQSRLPHKTSW